MPMGAPGRLRRRGAWRGQAQAGAKREGAGWAVGCVRVRLPAGQGGARRGKAGQGREELRRRERRRGCADGGAREAAAAGCLARAGASSRQAGRCREGSRVCEEVAAGGA